MQQNQMSPPLPRRKPFRLPTIAAAALAARLAYSPSPSQLMPSKTAKQNVGADCSIALQNVRDRRGNDVAARGSIAFGGQRVVELQRDGQGGLRLAGGLAAGLLAIGLALPAHAAVTIDGNCNIAVSGISGPAQITIYAPNCSAVALHPSQTFNKQDAQMCSCTSSGRFVRQLEAQIDRLCQGLCERPGFTQSYRMLSRIAGQLPACCHPDLMDQVQKANVSCKVKILARLWTKEDDRSEDDLIAQASKRFQDTPAPEECYRN